MSLDIESRLRIFLASAPQTIHKIGTLEISHSAMSRTFNLWREPPGSTFVGGVEHVMESANFEATLAGSPGNLDQVFSIKLGLVDVTDAFHEQLDRIPIDTTERIKIVYREFLSDDLTDPQATATLQAESVSWVKGAANISAVSPRLNISRTGLLYAPKDIPMLRGF